MGATMPDFTRDKDIRQILQNTKTIAVVGLSPKPYRPSHGVASYLDAQGFDIIPVNPKHDNILGKKCYPDLSAIEQSIDTVNVFRNPNYVMPIVEAAIAIGAPHLWLQEQVINNTAAQTALDAGMVVVMDRCMLKEHQRFC